MTGKTHEVGGLAAGFVVAALTKPSAEQAALGIVVACVASLFPDSISFRVPFIRWPVL